MRLGKRAKGNHGYRRTRCRPRCPRESSKARLHSRSVQTAMQSHGLLHILFIHLSVIWLSWQSPTVLQPLIATSLVGGGPAVMVWGCLLVSAVTQALALSFAEICSKFPTSAGGYYWYFHLALPRYKVLLCRINGWQSLWQAFGPLR